MNVEVTALADANLEEIYLRIRQDSSGRAAEWRTGLLKAAQSLNLFPERCPLAPESGPELEIRQLISASTASCSRSPRTPCCTFDTAPHSR